MQGYGGSGPAGTNPANPANPYDFNGVQVSKQTPLSLSIAIAIR